MIAKPKFCQLWLTCDDETEATSIAKVLLKKHLIACAKQIPVSSDFWWKGAVEHNDEMLLVMTSREDLFDYVEQEVAKLHSYETFDLQAIPVSKVSKAATTWLNQSIKHN